MATMNPTSDADALRLIQDTAVKAAGGASRIVSLPGEPAGVYGVLKSDGTIEKRFATKKARTHYLLSIGEISSALEHYKALSVDRVMSPVVWYHEEMVRVVLDDGTVLPFGDSLVVNLEKLQTDQWEEVLGLADKNLTQKGFIKLLRQDLWDCVGQAGADLVKQVRALDWSNSSHTQSKIEKGRASYGRDIEAEVRSQHGGELPDELILSVRIFNDPALKVRREICCVLEADPTSQTFNLSPYAGEIERALEDEMQHIHSILEGELSCSILYGKAGD